MKISDQKFYEIFNSKVFGGVIDTIVALRKMEQAGLLKLSKFQTEKTKEYYDRVMFRS